jgi:hypothetical protein
LKKSCVRKKKPRPKDLLFKLGLEAQSIDDWTTAEKIEASQKLSGTVDLKMIITPEVSKYLETQGIMSIDSWNNEKDYLWAIVKTCRIAKTKTGKEYFAGHPTPETEITAIFTEEETKPKKEIKKPKLKNDTTQNSWGKV